MSAEETKRGWRLHTLGKLEEGFQAAMFIDSFSEHVPRVKKPGSISELDCRVMNEVDLIPSLWSLKLGRIDR